MRYLIRFLTRNAGSHSVICMALILTVLAGCGKQSDMEVRFKAEKLLSEADRQRERLQMGSDESQGGDIAGVIAAYRKVVNEVDLPTNKDELQGASADRKQAWNLGLLARTRIASLFVDERQPDSAFAYYRLVLVNPAAEGLQKNVVLRFMASIKETLGNYGEAADLYDSVATGYLSIINPEAPEMDAISAPIKRAQMYNSLGNPARFRNEMDNARRYYRGLIDKYGDSKIAELAQGKIIASYLLQGEFDKALDILKTEGKDADGNLKPATLLLIAQIYLDDIRDYTRAARYYREFLRLYPDDNDYNKASLGLALSLYKNKKYDDALAVVEPLEKSPGVTEQVIAQAYFLMALCYEAQGKWDRAKGQLDLIKYTFPGSIEAYDAALYIVGHYRSRGQKASLERSFADAVDYIKKYSGSGTASTAIKARAQGYLVKAYIENGDFKEAVDNLEELYKKYPRSSDGLMAPVKIADIYENSLHDTTEAIKWLEVYLAGNKSGSDNLELENHIAALKGE